MNDIYSLICALEKKFSKVRKNIEKKIIGNLVEDQGKICINFVDDSHENRNSQIIL